MDRDTMDAVNAEEAMPGSARPPAEGRSDVGEAPPRRRPGKSVDRRPAKKGAKKGAAKGGAKRLASKGAKKAGLKKPPPRKGGRR